MEYIRIIAGGGSPGGDAPFYLSGRGEFYLIVGVFVAVIAMWYFSSKGRE